MRLITLFLISLVLISCKKERTIHITAKNAVTGVPYNGLTYYVVQEMTSGDGEKTKTVATGTLDGNGEAHLTKKLPKAYSYTVRVEAPANTCYNKQIAFHFANQETAFECAFEFVECAYLKFRYHNVSCQGATDHIEVTRITNLSGYTGFYNPAIYDGCTDYTMPDFVQIPMGNWYFTWNVTKNGITTSYSDTIFLAAGEHKYYEFNY